MGGAFEGYHKSRAFECRFVAKKLDLCGFLTFSMKCQIDI